MLARLWQRVPATARRVAAHEWVLLFVLLALTDRYFWLMDDAFIYFRYGVGVDSSSSTSTWSIATG